LLLTLGLNLIVQIKRPSYLSLVEQNLDIELSVTRGPSGSSLSIGKSLFNQERFAEAIDVFRREYEKPGISDLQKAVSAYFLGISFLKNSRETTFGLFPRFNPADLDSSLKYLGNAEGPLEGHSLAEEVDWYLALTETLHYSMSKSQPHYENANSYLNRTIEKSREHAEAAKEILETIKD